MGNFSDLGFGLALLAQQDDRDVGILGNFEGNVAFDHLAQQVFPRGS